MAEKYIGEEMILFKAHPIDQATVRGTKSDNLNDGEVRRNPGEPSPKDAKDDNYKKPVMKWRGLTIRIENPAGSVRRGNGWETRMKYDYGYISGSNGVDGDEVDVYLGPYLDTAELVYVVHQRKYGNWDKYDEDKCLIGFMSMDEAKAAYLAHYDDPRFLGPVSVFSVNEFIFKVKETNGGAKMLESKVLFFKAQVKGHSRRLKSGKVIFVNAYTNKVTAKSKQKNTMEESGKKPEKNQIANKVANKSEPKAKITRKTRDSDNNKKSKERIQLEKNMSIIKKSKLVDASGKPIKKEDPMSALGGAQTTLMLAHGDYEKARKDLEEHLKEYEEEPKSMFTEGLVKIKKKEIAELEKMRKQGVKVL